MQDEKFLSNTFSSMPASSPLSWALEVLSGIGNSLRNFGNVWVLNFWSLGKGRFLGGVLAKENT